MTLRQNSSTPRLITGPNADDRYPRRQWGESLQPPVPAVLPDDESTAGAIPSESTRHGTERARRLGQRTDPCWFLG